MNEKTKAGVAAALEFAKGMVRPTVVVSMSAVICVMTYEARIDAITWHFWVTYSGFAGEWIGERAIKRFKEIKKS